LRESGKILTHILNIEGVPEAPEEEFEIEYVYGYRTFDSRQNLRYNAKGQPVFMVAALGVILDPETNIQKIFGGKETKMVAKNEADDSKFHMDDILSLDISTDRKTVVTGQVGKAPSVHVWDAETAEAKCTFKLKEGSRGVSGISISPCQRYVACVDLHNDHHVVIYNIKKGKQLLHIEGSKENIIQVAWSKKADDLRFVTVGLKELKFWNPADATKRLSTKGTFGTKGAITSFLGASFDTEGNCYTAGANGSIYIWDSNAQLDKVVKGHSTEVTAITCENGKLITGGKDKKVFIHSIANGELSLEKTIELD
jgi:microtubule-associated protein-like 6